MLCLLFGFTREGSEGWTNAVVIGSCLLGLVLLALFAMTERRVHWPLVDLALFRSRAAADQFTATGAGASRLLIEAVILQGFQLTALTCLVLCSGAAVLAFLLRRRGRNRGMTKPVQQEERRLAVSPDG